MRFDKLCKEWCPAGNINAGVGNDHASNRTYWSIHYRPFPYTSKVSLVENYLFVSYSSLVLSQNVIIFFRGMAMCLTMMVGRSGAIFGSNLVGSLINSACEANFYIFGGLLLSM